MSVALYPGNFVQHDGEITDDYEDLTDGTYTLLRPVGPDAGSLEFLQGVFTDR